VKVRRRDGKGKGLRYDVRADQFSILAEGDTNLDSESDVGNLLFLVFCLAIIVPASLAAVMGRSVLLWICISLFLSPILAVLLLAVLGSKRGTRHRKSRRS
jgi:hypothetical protein